MTGGRTLALHAWGDAEDPRVVCLHGVTSWGGHFRELAGRGLAHGRRVLAPDLLGHGSSPYEPPWDAAAHLGALRATVGDGPGVVIGHSFGARLAFELAALEPARVSRLVLLDPVIRLAPQVALFAAESARGERVYATFSEGVGRRYEESQLHRAPRALVEEELREHLVRGAGGWRYRYSQSAVVAAYGVMSTRPPEYEAVRVPTLVVLGERSYVPYDHLLEDHAAALGDLLEVIRVPGGHTVLWDALDETAAAILRFLA